MKGQKCVVETGCAVWECTEHWNITSLYAEHFTHENVVCRSECNPNIVFMLYCLFPQKSRIINVEGKKVKVDIVSSVNYDSVLW